MSTGFVEDYLAALLALASHRVSAEFHATVRAAGLAVAEWRILATLSGGQPLPVGRLAHIVIAPQPTVTRQLDRMAAKGWVERLPHSADRRQTLVRATPAGEALAAQLIAQAQAHERQVLAPLGDDAAAALKHMLRAMVRLEASGGGEPGTAWLRRSEVAQQAPATPSSHVNRRAKRGLRMD